MRIEKAIVSKDARKKEIQEKLSLSGRRWDPSHKRARVHNNLKSEHLLIKLKLLEESNNTNVIDISHDVNTFFHTIKIDSTIKYGLPDTGASGTYIRPYDPQENSHKRGYTIFISSSCGKIQFQKQRTQ